MDAALTDLVGYKIVILIGTFARGGCERQAYLLSRELKHHHGLDVEVWALKNPGEYQRDFEAEGVSTRALLFSKPRYGWPRRCYPILRAFRENRVGILLPFTTWPNVVAGLTYRLAGVKLCIWGERHAGGERIPFVERIAITQYRQFVANSTAGVEFLASEMRVPRSRIAFVPNGVEELPANQGANWRERLGVGPDQTVVVKVANVTSFKDHATLLRAWKIVQEEWRDSARPVLVLAGYHADTYENCRHIVDEAGLDETVRFLGGITDVPALLNASDMAAFSSRNEGMPNGVLECMAAGKAVVASDLPGIRDALGPNARDMLVRPGNVQEFAAKLLQLLRNKDRRIEIGAANRERIRSEFSVSRMTERYLQIVQTNLIRPKLRRREVGLQGMAEEA